MDISNIQTNINKIKGLKNGSKEMCDAINSLSAEDYAAVSTAFIIGRDGYERSYSDTTEYYAFCEQKEAEGIPVTNELADSHFLTKEAKQKQIDLTYYVELKDAQHKSGGEYNHNWLSTKPNLANTLQKGLKLISQD